MKSPFVFIFVIFLAVACLKKPTNRNLNYWEGEWDIVQVALSTGESGIFTEEYKTSVPIIDNYGSLSVDNEGKAILYLRNIDYSDVDAPVTLTGFVKYEGRHQLGLMGLYVTASESASPFFQIDKRACMDGELSFFTVQSSAKKRVLKIDYLNFYCHFDEVTVGDKEYFWFLEKQ